VLTEFRTFFHFRTFRMLYEISENSAEFRIVPRNFSKFCFCNLDFFKKTYENVRFLTLKKYLQFLRHNLLLKGPFK
jgi:hypothetical protein